MTIERIMGIGGGFVGLTLAGFLAESGFTNILYDINEEKIKDYQTLETKLIQKHVNEPNLAELIQQGVQQGRLSFTSNLKEVYDVGAPQIVFLSLPTPTREDRPEVNLDYIKTAMNELAIYQPKNEHIVVVNKSTVPPGTARMIHDFLSTRLSRYSVVANPEFLAEGRAVEQMRTPYRNIVGSFDDAGFEAMRECYARHISNVNIGYLETTPETAEMTKLYSNQMLFQRVDNFNTLARHAELTPNVRIEDLVRGVTMDKRIGFWGSYVGIGAGGSCFKKDLLNLIGDFRAKGLDTKMFESIEEHNESQKTYLVERVERELGFDWNKSRVALLGLSFKKDTNDIRESSSIALLQKLLTKGAMVNVYDPASLDMVEKSFGGGKRIVYCTREDACLMGTKMCFIGTDWEQFRTLDKTIQQVCPPPYIIVDGRNMIKNYQELVSKGYTYVSVGRPTL